MILFTGALFSQIQVGDIAPDFTVTDVEGNSHTLYTYTSGGQYVMLDFFFTTCGPCQYYTPQISQAYETYGCNQGDLVVLGIDYLDTNEEVIQYDLTYGAIYPSVSGNGGGGNAVVEDYGIVGFPFVCLIDTTNTVVQIFDIPTMQVFSYYFGLYGIEEMQCATGIHDNSRISDIQVYPNPVSSMLRIDASVGTLISVYSSDGAMVTRFDMANETFYFDVSGLNRGFYIMKANTGNRQTVLKIAVN